MRNTIVAGGLDWTVETQPLVVNITVKDDQGEPAAQLQPIPHSFINFRSDNNDILGIVKDKYRIVQNRKTFAVMDDIASTTKAKYVSVGHEGRGERVFIVALLPGDLQIVGTNDKVEKYLMCTASHDGKSSVVMGFNPIHATSRAVLSLSRKGLQDRVSVRHTSTNERRLSEAVRVLQMADNYFSELENVFTGLSKVPFTSDMMDTVLDEILPFAADATRKTRTENNRDKVRQFYGSSTGIAPEVKGTAWAAFLACAEYAEFGKAFSGHKDKSTVAENRFKSLTGGTAYTFKNAAFNSIADIAGV
jgi:phage/plasmid-like protein (TIGR03299 family)